MPFDRFTIQQIAGDELPNATVEEKVATGFQRNTLTNREGGIDTEQFRFENLVDRTATVGTVWLGLTIGCAQCHDHKYDPLKQKDFYRLSAFFDNVEEVDIDAAMPGELGPWLAKRDEYRAKRDQLLKDYHIAELQTAWEKDMVRAAAHPGERTDWDLAWDCLLKLTEGGDGEKIIREDPPSRTQPELDVLTDHFVRNYHFAVGDKKYKELKFDELDKKLRELYAAYPQLTRAMTLADSTRAASDQTAGSRRLQEPGNCRRAGRARKFYSRLPPLMLLGSIWRVGSYRAIIHSLARVAVNHVGRNISAKGW